MKLKRITTAILMMTLVITLFSGCSNSEKTSSEKLGTEKSGSKELNLYTWAEYMPRSVIDGFEKETGIKVNYSNFETNEEMLSKLEVTKGGDYDIVIASDYIIKLAADENLVMKLDKSLIPNFQNIDPIYQNFFYDPDNTLTVPYAPGIPLIVYNPATVDIDITGYESLWDPALKNRVGLMDTERVVMGIALKTLGESFNTENLDVIQEAGNKLIDLAPNIRLLSQDQTQDYLVSGEIDVAFLFTSQVVLALQANPDLKVVYPVEGLGFGVDAAFIPAKAPNSDNAHKFFEYILRGEVGADIATQTYYLCPNKASYEFLPVEFQKSLMITTDDIPKGEFIQDIGKDAMDKHDELWTEFKASLK